MQINFNKGDGLVPVIIQNSNTLQVLMLGYMNQEAYEKTKKEGLVTFFSRSKNRLWTKGESSENYLRVEDIAIDCDSDTILIKATQDGPTCHTGSTSCFKEETSKGFIYQLEKTIAQRIDEDDPNSYTNNLFKSGINKVAQKVGEEAVEVVIEAKDDNDDLFKNEMADLLYHTLILMKAKNIELEEIEKVLMARNG
ncbi:MAG: bifunctional phosphoribosyl-AMP cyclohydrolase/phosphoribosyl-ATP diphosphatase HisIE [Crocinitomicaceae bacterium]|nr:bifunctional phosphoribosyl-AMP cyclohydrolase/phosphoribosyl-ATP diphosphatase HisIE [Crocinitomicaceae bacterium]MDG1658387.1 bifunctional phosphoribosyl-AMP cyclohydrolase/phosphoribosyl-ATP diphosphatase HisIE [Crocinitomicaceae bacterium]